MMPHLYSPFRIRLNVAPVVIKIHYLTTLDKQTKNDAHTKLNFEAIGL